MISVVVCSRTPLAVQRHRANVENTIGTDLEYIPVLNPRGEFGMAEAYNRGVRCSAGEIVVFVHDDVFFLSPGWGEVLESRFANMQIGLVGLAGTSYLARTNPLWCSAQRPFIHGHVIHNRGYSDPCLLSVFCAHDQDCEIVVADGLFLAVRRSLFDQISFDSTIFDRFHFYDLDICMQVRRLAKLIVCPHIEVKHMSGGTFNDEWKKYAALFVQKYALELPANCSPLNPDATPRQEFEAFNCDTIMSPTTVAAIRKLGTGDI